MKDQKESMIEPMDPKQQPPYPLRMPPEMRAHFEDLARAAKRSLNAEIVATLGEVQELRNQVESLTNELEDRNVGADRQRGVLEQAQAMFGLLQGRLREAKSKLSADEAAELNSLLSDIHEELAKPEPIDALLERARALYEESNAIDRRLRELGATVPSETIARLQELETKWAQVKAARDAIDRMPKPKPTPITKP